VHQNRFRLGLRPTPHYGSSPQTTSWTLGVLILRAGRGGKERKGGREKAKEKNEGGARHTVHIFGYAIVLVGPKIFGFS